MPTPRLLLFSLLLHFSAHSAVAATDIIDASVVSVGVSTMNTVTNKGITLLADDYGPFSIALKDSRYTPVCRWTFPQPLGQATTAVAKDRLIFWIEFFLDNQSLEVKRWDLEKGEHFGKTVITTALKKLQMNPGKHTVSRKVWYQYSTVGEKPEDPKPSNNTMSTLLLVTNEKLDPLFAEEFPAVTATATPESARLEPGAMIILGIKVSYYVPETPVVSAIAAQLLVNDQFEIRCSFRKVTREVEWPMCDDGARTSMQVLKLAEEAGGRYSGIVSIDGNSVGVSSSPEDGGDFAGTQTWQFEEPGAQEVSCQVDNAFHHAAAAEPTARDGQFRMLQNEAQ